VPFYYLAVCILQVSQLKLEFDRLMSANQTVTNRAEKLAADNARLQELCNHQRKQVDDQREQLATLQHSLKHGGNNSTNVKQSTSTVPVVG
jgi:uncharacterized membrane protein